MQLPRTPELRANAQALRKEMTPQERKLWFQFLRRLNVRVNRQKVIGYYIADFYCHAAKVVIELDGSQHFEGNGGRTRPGSGQLFARAWPDCAAVQQPGYEGEL